MTSPFHDNVFETTTTTGTGALTLAGAVTGARTFRTAFGDGPVAVGYIMRSAVEDGEFEVGFGTYEYTGGNGTLTRATVLQSSNSDAAVNWGAGTRNVWCGPPADLLNWLIKGKAQWAAAGGTSDAITATLPAPIALEDGMLICVRAGAANTTTTPTLSVNGGTGRTIVKNGGSALAIGDIAGANHELLFRYYASSTRHELLNPAGSAFGRSIFGAADAAAGRTALGLGTISTQAASAVAITGGTITFGSSELTIASGSITPTRQNHTVDTEGDAASDALATVVVDNIPDEGFLTLRAAHTDRTVVIDDAAGNLFTADSADFSLDDAEKSITFQRRGSNFYEVSRSWVSAGVTFYESAEQTVAVTDSHTLTHGLGGVPRGINLWLVCQTGELGWTAGDRVLIGVNMDIGSSANRHIGLKVTSTQILIKMGADALALSDYSDGTSNFITTANWRLVVTAWR